VVNVAIPIGVAISKGCAARCAKVALPSQEIGTVNRAVDIKITGKTRR
jgi:hypothetical protein